MGWEGYQETQATEKLRKAAQEIVVRNWLVFLVCFFGVFFFSCFLIQASCGSRVGVGEEPSKQFWTLVTAHMGSVLRNRRRRK